MPFGLRNAATTFQKSINDALGEHCKYRKVYLGDIAIFSCDWSTHLKHPGAVLCKLTELKFTVNGKCVFSRNRKLNIWVISQEQEGINEIRRNYVPLKQQNQLKKAALKSAVGLFSYYYYYYHDYIKYYSEIANSLTDLTKKKSFFRNHLMVRG